MSNPDSFLLLVLIQLITSFFCGFFAYNLYARKKVSGALYLSFLMTSLGVWALASGLENLFDQFPTKILFAKVSHLGIQSASPLLFLFVLEYSGYKNRITKKRLILLWTIPIIAVILTATNDFHHLIWTRITSSLIKDHSILIYEHGIGFWISVTFHYILMAISSILLIWSTKGKRQKKLFGRLSLFLIALSVSWGANLAYLTGKIPIHGIDITPIAFLITAILVFLAVYPLHFLDIPPMARSALIDNMNAPFFIFDEDNRLVDTNPVGQAFINIQNESIIGASVREIFSQWPSLINLLIYPTDNEKRILDIYVSENIWFNVYITSLKGKKGNHIGWMIVFHDISQNKTIEQELTEQANGLRIVSEISLAIAASKQPHNLLHEVVELTSQRFQFYFVQIYLIENQQRILQLAAASGETGRQLLAVKHTLPLNSKKSIVAWAARNKNALIVEDVLTDSRYLSHHNLPDTRSEMAIPILYGDELLGILDIQSERIGRFSEMDLHIHSTLAAQISTALMNARLFEDLNRRAMEAETLRQASSVVVSSLQQEKAVELILEQLRKVVPYDSSSVQLLKEDYLEIIGGHGFPNLSGVIGMRFPINGQSGSAIVYRSKTPIIVQDVTKNFPEFQKTNIVDEIRSWMGVPLMVQDNVIGLITLDSYTPGTFQPFQAQLVQAFADHVTIALENARLFEDTRRLAITDPLTNIYNRRYFFELAQIEFQRSFRYHHPLSAIMFDLDHFKEINDAHGHSIGDQVLKAVAQTCNVRLRKSDIISRYGGEEFVILMPETDEQRAWSVAERLRRSVARLSIPGNDEKINITISLGVATLTGEQLLEDCSDEILKRLIDKADQALYQAKQAGRNRVVVYQALENI